MEGKNPSLLFVLWWYDDVSAHLFTYLRKYFLYLADLFSVEICLKTLFAVWRRDEISYDALSIHERFEAWSLNLVSRFIGFLVKIFTLITYIVVSVIFLIIALVIILVWFLYPVIALSLIIYGLKIAIGQ